MCAYLIKTTPAQNIVLPGVLQYPAPSDHHRDGAAATAAVAAGCAAGAAAAAAAAGAAARFDSCMSGLFGNTVDWQLFRAARSDSAMRGPLTV